VLTHNISRIIILRGKNSKSNITLTVIKLELCIKYLDKVSPATDHEAPEGE
jgi:hypothetical protein